MTGPIEQTGFAPVGSTLGGSLFTTSLPTPNTIVIVPIGWPLAKTRKVVPLGTRALISTTRSCFTKVGVLVIARTRALASAAIAFPAGEATSLIDFWQSAEAYVAAPSIIARPSVAAVS